MRQWLQRAIGVPIAWVSSLVHGRPAWTDWSVMKAIKEGYRAHSTVYTCVRRLSDAVSSVPWVLKRRTADGDEVVTDHPAAALLLRPNPRWSWQDMMQALTLDLNLGGNAYWLLLRKGTGRTSAQELWRLRPDQVKPIPGKNVWVSGYEWTVGQEKTTLPPRDDERGMAVIHFRFIDPGDDILGLSPLRAASKVVDTDTAALEWNWNALRNQARPPGALSAPKRLDDAQHKRLRKQLDDLVAGPENARRPLLLEGGLTWQQHGFSPTDMDFLKGREANAVEICNIFGVRPEWVGRLEAKFENARQGRRMTWEDTIIAFFVDVRGTLNLVLAPIYGDDLFYDYDLSQTPAVLEARGELIEQAKKVWDMGVPFNQVNDQFGLGFDPVPGGDTGYLPATLLPMGSGEGTQTAVLALPAPAPARVTVLDRPEPTAAPRVLNVETEEQKKAHWRASDRQRLAWERGVAEKIKERFAAELQVLLGQLEAGVHDLSIAIGSELPAWEELLTAVWRAVFEHFGAQTAKALGMEVDQGSSPAHREVWDPWPVEAQTFIADVVGDHIVRISTATKLAVRKEIAEGLAASEGTPKIAKRLQGLYDGFGRNRSFVIARTEVGGAANYGTHMAAVRSRVVETHTWVSSKDERVRDSHVAIDGQTKPLGERYSNGCMQPCDPAGPAAEVIQCRCVETFGTKKAS